MRISAPACRNSSATSASACLQPPNRQHFVDPMRASWLGLPSSAARRWVISPHRLVGDKPHEKAARADLRRDAGRDANDGYSTRHITRDDRPRAHGYVVANSHPSHDARVGSQKDAVSKHWILATDLTECDPLMDAAIRPHLNTLVHDNRTGVGYAEASPEDVRGNCETQSLAEEIDAEVKPEFHYTTNRIATAIEPIFMASIETLVVAHPS